MENRSVIHFYNKQYMPHSGVVHGWRRHGLNFSLIPKEEPVPGNRKYPVRRNKSQEPTAEETFIPFMHGEKKTTAYIF